MTGRTDIDRVVLVTGGASGIGAAVCRLFAGPGTNVFIHAKDNMTGCEQVAREVEEAGGSAQHLCLDLAAEGAGTQLVEAVLQSFGRLDVLVANAGFPHRGGLAEVDRSDLNYCLAAMPGAFLEMAKAAIPWLRQAEHGRVIAVSAHAAHMFRANYPIFPASAAAKRALEALVHSLAIELAADGVTVNAVVPGLITKDADRDQFLGDQERTDLAAHVPMGRFGSPSEVAQMIHFLASPAASYVTNQVIHVNGGMV